MRADQQFAPPRVSEALRSMFDNMNDVTQEQLAEALGVSRHSVNELMNNRRTVTATMALRLAKVLGTDPRFWLNLQLESDLFEASKELTDVVEGLPVLATGRSEDEIIKPASELFSTAS